MNDVLSSVDPSWADDGSDPKHTPTLVNALERIESFEYRSDRRHKHMVDVAEIETVKRIARAALAAVRGTK